MKEFGRGIDPKTFARKAVLAASLPLAAGLSACGGGSSKLERPTQIPYATAAPTPEPQPVSVITCPPTNPHSPESYERIIKETVDQHGGAIILTLNGLKCNGYPTEFTIGSNQRGGRLFEDPSITQISTHGYTDGSPVTLVTPATSCSSEYIIGLVLRNPTVPIPTVDVFLQTFRDEKTGHNSPYFSLDENCTKTITFGEAKKDTAN